MDAEKRKQLLQATAAGRAILEQEEAEAKAKAKLDGDNDSDMKTASIEKEMKRFNNLANMKASLEGAGLTFADNSKSRRDYLLSLTPAGQSAFQDKLN